MYKEEVRDSRKSVLQNKQETYRCWRRYDVPHYKSRFFLIASPPSLAEGLTMEPTTMQRFFIKRCSHCIA